MDDPEVWISAADLKRLVPLTMRYSLDQKVRECAGFGLLRIRLKVADLTGEGVCKRVNNYLVEARFLESTTKELSRARIDLDGDRFSSRYPATLIGVTRDQVVKGIGLMFAARDVANAFGLVGEPTPFELLGNEADEGRTPRFSTGLAGRPTKSREPIEDLHSQRISTGTALKSVTAEATELVRLFREAPDRGGLPVPTAKTVENCIRARHRQAFALK